MKNSVLILLFILLPVLMMCSRKRETPLTEEQIRSTREALIGANRILLKKDRSRIIAYIDSNNLSLKETESGLWYEITGNGNGPEAKEGSLVTIDYKVSLLDGTTCYSSDAIGYKQFRIGQGDIESGIDEGIRMLREGSEAIFILPPHLAHGLSGDGDCIPARSIIVYHLKVISVES